MNRRNLSRTRVASVIATSGLLWALAGQALSAEQAEMRHPVHGHLGSHLIDLVYGPGHGLPASWSSGDLVFPESYPLASTLSEEEKYIIAGSASSEWDSQRGLNAWSNNVYSVVSKYYDQYGTVPAQLTPAVLRSIAGFESMPAENLREFLNPLTDTWPRLDARTAAQGDVYIRPLTQAEVGHFAGKSERYKRTFIERKVSDPQSGEVRPIELHGEIFYMRVYGSQGIIFANLMYTYTLAD